MDFTVKVSDFTLLSEERQLAYNRSSPTNKNSRKRVNEICKYIREILQWTRLDRLAEQYNVDPRVIIILSNYANGKRALEQELNHGFWFLSQIRSDEELLELRDIIETEFEDFGGFDIKYIWSLDRIWAKRKDSRITYERYNYKKASKYETWLWKLLDFFSMDNTPENIDSLLEQIWGLACTQDIIEYCTEEGISTIKGLVQWDYLLWHAEKYNYPTSPKDLEFLKQFLSF